MQVGCVPWGTGQRPPPSSLLNHHGHGRVSRLLHRNDARTVIALSPGSFAANSMNSGMSWRVPPTEAKHPGVRMRGFPGLRGVPLRLAVEEELHHPVHLVVLADRIWGVAGLSKS